MFTLIKRAFQDWKEDECPRMAAAMSYYTVFSLPPLLLIVLIVVGVFVDPMAFSGRIESEIASVLGPGSADQVAEMIRYVDRPGTGGPLVAFLSAFGLLFGATGAFHQLQDALNRAWEVRTDPSRGAMWAILTKRLVSLGMVLTIAFLLLVSMVLSAALGAGGEVVAGWFGDASVMLIHVLNAVVSLAVVTGLLALIFRYLPDARIEWSDVWVGAIGTALLLSAGKLLLGYYFAESDPGRVFGAAGSLALIMLWIYYSALILLFGAEFTQVWATERGKGIRPEEHAVPAPR